MKTPAFNYKILSIILLFITTAAFAQVEKTKEVNRTFKVTPNTSLRIDNRYGKVHIDTWDKNEITVDIKVTVTKRSNSRAQEILDKIDFSISETPSAVSIETNINGSINTGRDDDFSIDYKVNMPKSNPLYVSHRYGSFYLDDFAGKLELEIKYASMKVQEVTGKAYIELAYGSGQIESLTNGELEISYSKMSVGSIGNMDVISKYSNVQFDRTGMLYLENKYGDINIGEAVGIEGAVKYGGLKVDKLSKVLIMETKYGSGVDIDWISKDFERIRLRSGYAASSLYFEKGFSANFSGNFKYCNLRYPESDFDFRTIHEGNHSSEYRGVLGKGSGNSEITIDSEYGNVKIGYAY